MRKKLAIVLSGGGARGAFQAGVLRALWEISAHLGLDKEVFRNLTGVSAGSINVTYLAAHMENLEEGTRHLCEMWRTLEAEDVFNTDYSSVTKNALKLVRGVSLGGLSQRLRPVSVGLLNTDPLRDLLKRRIPLGRIQDHISQGLLDSVSISATDYSTSVGITFVQGKPGLPMWKSANRISMASDLRVDHIMASSAIPIFFPPVTVDDRHFGDGCLRNTAPLSPAVHLGAEKLLVVGVRRMLDAAELLKAPILEPSMGRVLSVLINAIFMDAVEADLERLKVVNDSVTRLREAGVETRLRTIEAHYIRPSEGLSDIASARADDLPRIIKFLLQGLGTAQEASEILSYLLFEPGYCGSLVDLGYRDTMAQSEAIGKFLSQ